MFSFSSSAWCFFASAKHNIQNYSSWCLVTLGEKFDNDDQFRVLFDRGKIMIDGFFLSSANVYDNSLCRVLWVIIETKESKSSAKSKRTMLL